MPCLCRVPEECPAEIRDVIMACRASNPVDRPTAREVFRRLSAVIHPNRPRPASSILSSSSMWSSQTSFHGRPSWAPPEHAEGEENPSFMACIHEHSPADVSSLDKSADPLRQQLQRGSPARQQQPWGMKQAVKSNNGETAYSRTMSL